MIAAAISSRTRAVFRRAGSQCLGLSWLLILAGCASVTGGDNVPPGVPKGYVEFLWVSWMPSVGAPDKETENYRVYSTVDNREVRETPFSVWRHADWSGMRFAKEAGTYDFIVRVGTAAKSVQLDVSEGMVTPVKIFFENIRSEPIQPTAESPRGGETTYFTLNLVVGQARPVDSGQAGR